MPPFLPPELVTITFEHLYDSLCYSTGREMYDTPIGAGYIFSNLSLVSKTWHSLALPFLVRNFEDTYISERKLIQFTKCLRKYSLGKHVESVSVVLSSKNGTSSLPLVRQLFSEIGPVWKPRMVELGLREIDASPASEFLLASLPFFRETNSLRLIDVPLDFLPESISQQPTHLSILDCRLEGGHSEQDDVTTSLQFEIARRCFRTLRVLSIRRTEPYWVQSAQTIFRETVFPSLTNLHLSAIGFTDFDASEHFPRLRSAFLPLPWNHTGLQLSNLPQSLQHLTLSNIGEFSFYLIADLKNSLASVESLKQLGICVNVSESMTDFKSVRDFCKHSRYLVLSDFCSDRGIKLSCYEWDPILGEVLESTKEESGVLSAVEEERNYNVEEEDGGESDSEDEEDLDFDAEDGEEFRHLWSEEKLAELAQEEKVYSVEETKGGTFGFET
ncbi:hypothetical protein JCM5350_005147 [Sporobolomyces pararoseus]